MTAVVPAYNEEDRVANVLETLSRVSLITDIIVVDDGSTDRTGEVAAEFKNVQVLRNPVNQGKGLAMDRGVQAAAGEVIFFCDADLEGFGPGIVEEIIRPVVDEEFDMFVGAREFRENIITRAFVFLETKWGIYPTTGQRALRKELWQKLPEGYKRNFRAEVGLNYVARRSRKGLGYKKFVYRHHKKEKKFGILKGLRVKFKMYANVFGASLRFRTVDRDLPGAWDGGDRGGKIRP
ncbi:MAG TPA: glycosyltransferase family 2 protein [Acidobacteriota bacterium]|nr:glycosyltransferase family 2 protein [Acidobacteriota bacterium]